jgi:hypothetical protein
LDKKAKCVQRSSSWQLASLVGLVQRSANFQFWLINSQLSTSWTIESERNNLRLQLCKAETITYVAVIIISLDYFEEDQKERVDGQHNDDDAKILEESY